MFLENDIYSSQLSFSSCGLFVSRGEWIHPERIIDTFEIILVLSGKVYIREGECDYALQENDVLVLHPGICHKGTKYSRDVSFYWMHFSTDAEFCDKCFSFTDTASLVGYFRNLLHVTNTRSYPQSSAEYLVRLIINEIDFQCTRQQLSKSIVYKAAEYAATNASAALSVSDVADHFGYNSDYLCRMFKKTLGVGLKQFIDEEILKKAKIRLTQSGGDISDIGISLGFDSGNTFSKFFKYHEGITPSQYSSMHFNTRINHS